MGALIAPRRRPARPPGGGLEATTDWHDALEPVGGSYSEPYWLLEDGQRVGTIALSRTCYGVADMRVWSLYVLRSRRGLGTGRRALDRLRELAAAEELGVRLDTCWSWQRTVRFYLRAGMWAHMWKRDLTLRWDARCPPRVIDVGPDEATLTVMREGEPVVLSRARRRGETLELDEPWRPFMKDDLLGEVVYDADPTLALALALALALEGWPLIRSQALWDKHRGSDGGPPESLAYKISTWEAWDRRHGWRVETPTIPGLEYPELGGVRAALGSRDGGVQDRVPVTVADATARRDSAPGTAPSVSAGPVRGDFPPLPCPAPTVPRRTPRVTGRGMSFAAIAC